MTTKQEFRTQICEINRELPRAGLVTMHSGNASVYSPEHGCIFIKPSGMDYSHMTPETMVEVDVQTGIFYGEYRPSVDLPHHLYLYKHLPDARSIIHTHSNYATAFAAVHKSIPLVLTAIADEFGSEVPCTPYIGNEENEIGRAIIQYRTKAPAVLLGNHGVFCWGHTPAAALKAAVMVEDVARTVFLAYQLGVPVPIPAVEAAKWYERYHSRYGQLDNKTYDREAA